MKSEESHINKVTFRIWGVALFFILHALLFTFTSCRPGIPSDVLSEGDMVDILYDIHVAQAMSESGAMKDKKDVVALRAAVLKKHDVTQEEYDHSYLFYCSHAEYMHEIYQDLSEKIRDNVVAAGGKIQGIETEEADTANVWNMEHNMVFMDQPPYNRVSFSVMPDSTFNIGDRINLQYESQILVQEGISDMTVCLNVFYTDSTSISKVSHITSSGKGNVSVSADSLMVKKMTGFFMMTPQNNENNKKAFRLFVLRNIKLLHLPSTEKSQDGDKEKQHTDQE